MKNFGQKLDKISILKYVFKAYLRVLSKGENLMKGQELISKNRKFTAKIGEDGYFRVYYLNYGLWGYTSSIDRFEMQPDGNFIIYDAQNKTSITSSTEGKGHYFVLDNDGSIKVYDKFETLLWYNGFILSK